MITLRAKLPSGSNEKVTISSNSTFKDLLKLLQSLYPELSSNKKEKDENVITILQGYPPQKINFDDNQDEIISKLFRHMEPIIVQLQGGVTKASSPSLAARQTKKKAVSTKAKDQTKDQANAKVVSKRKASVIENASVKSSKLSFGANVHTIGAGSGKTGGVKATKASKTGAKPSTKLSFGATTSTLSGGRSKAGIASSKKRSSSSGVVRDGAKRKSRLTLTSQEDIGTSLLNAVSSGSGGKKNKFLRGTFRRAVALEYEASQAQARVMSLISGKYSIQESRTVRTLGSTIEQSEATQIIVQYHKGHGNRSFHFETVELLSRPQLKAVVTLLLAPSISPGEGTRTDSTTSDTKELGDEEEEDGDVGRELLRARYMAKCSPRVFWSLVHHFGPSIPVALSQLLPDLDWTWLVGDDEGESGSTGGRRRRDGLGGGKDGDSVRRRQLSEKAQENQRQTRAAAREAQDRKDIKRLLAEAKKMKHNDSNSTNEILQVESQAGEAQVVSSSNYCGPVSEAEDMLRALLLTGHDSRSGDSGHVRFQQFIEAFSEVFQVKEFSSRREGHSSSCDSNIDGLNIFVQIMQVLADTTPPPLNLNDDDDENENAITESLFLLQAIRTQLQRQSLACKPPSPEKTVPFITLLHLRYWITTARWMLVTHFWAVEAPGPSGSDGKWSYVLSQRGIKRVRDLALWRHAPSDLVTYLQSEATTSCEVPNEKELERMCLIAESFREQCDWVDAWVDSDLECAHSSVYRNHDDNNMPWYRSKPPAYCFDSSPEAVLLALNRPGPTNIDNGDVDDWILLTDQPEYEQVMCLRQFNLPTTDRSLAEKSMCLGLKVQFYLTDDGEVKSARNQLVVDQSDRNCDNSTAKEIENGISEELSGVVVAYLPPSSEEPMALWKILLHNGQWQDLEQHELREALLHE